MQTMQAYMQELARFGRISSEEEVELSRSIQVMQQLFRIAPALADPAVDQHPLEIGQPVAALADALADMEHAARAANRVAGAPRHGCMAQLLRHTKGTPLLAGKYDQCLLDALQDSSSPQKDIMLLDCLLEMVPEEAAQRIGGPAAAEVPLGDEARAAMRREFAAPDLARRWRSHWLGISRRGVEARTKLVEANLRLVFSLAASRNLQGVELLDLIQGGNIGLLKAADRFDFRLGYKFSTYATWWIRQAVAKEYNDALRSIHLPTHVVERLGRIQRARTQLEQELGREATNEHLAKVLQMQPEELDKTLALAKPVLSLDEPQGAGEMGDSPNTLMDMLEDEEQARQREEDQQRAALAAAISSAFSELKENQREVLRLRFGIGGRRPMTLEQTGREIGSTKERARQVERAALQQIKRTLAAAELRQHWLGT